MNRRDIARIAAVKAREAAESHGWSSPRTVGSAVASDAFFPFADGLLAAAEAGATCVIQDRKSVVSGKSVSVRVDLGGRRIIKKKQRNTRTISEDALQSINLSERTISIIKTSSPKKALAKK